MVSGGDKPAAVAGGVWEGTDLSIPAGGRVIGGGGGAWWQRRREEGWEEERGQFHSAAAGVSIFREIGGDIGRWRIIFPPLTIFWGSTRCVVRKDNRIYPPLRPHWGSVRNALTQFRSEIVENRVLQPINHVMCMCCSALHTINCILAAPL